MRDSKATVTFYDCSTNAGSYRYGKANMVSKALRMRRSMAALTVLVTVVSVCAVAPPFSGN
jgi:hypothetical protein